MKKVMYLFSFLAFMAASNLNAQSSACNEICPPGCCILDCKPSQCTPAQLKACQAKQTKASTASVKTPTPKAINCKPSQCTPVERKACQTKASMAHTETSAPKAIQASLEDNSVKNNSTTPCCSSLSATLSTWLGTDAAPAASCEKGKVKAVKANYQATKTACCDWPCCPLQPATKTKMACAK